jgi:alkylation response protein AidB-like acyl-CoA dehydrogenase
MHAADDEPGDAGETLARAVAALGPRLRESAEQSERERRVPADIITAMVDAGIFRMCVPRSVGGGEVDPFTLVRVLEDLSAADASAGWCAMIGATSGLVAGYLDADIARDLYGDNPRAITGGVFAPHGRARVVEGGYRVTGRWPFASGCEHSTLLMGGCVVEDAEGPRLLPTGLPDPRLMLFPASAARIVDTWSVSGLRGTGSHDIEVADLFVPASWSVSLVTDGPRETGLLFAFPVFGLLAVGIAAVALGIARSAVAELVRLASGKRPTGTRRLLSERAAVQAQVAEAEALVGSARAYLSDRIGAAWEAAEASGTIPIPLRAGVRLAAAHATRSAARAVDLMYEAGGGTSVYATSPLQRHFRDVHVVTQHVMVAPATYELTGRLLLGVDTDTGML